MVLLGGVDMNHKSLVSLLTNGREEIVRRFGIKKLGLFGSAARDEMHEGSDIDVLVEFQAPPLSMPIWILSFIWKTFSIRASIWSLMTP